jgi:hypothetical protein
MASMQWLWKRVCSAECTTLCKAYCPGCRARASEWAGQDQHAVSRTSTAASLLSRLEAAVRCTVRCAASDAKALVTRRRERVNTEILQIGSSLPKERDSEYQSPAGPQGDPKGGDPESHIVSI